MVTGKNKEHFEEWYIEHFKCMNPLVQSVNQFYQLERFEMQIGVYLDYYDSKGIVITDVCISGTWRCRIIKHEGGNYKPYNFKGKWYKQRPEAYKEAFKEADKLINDLWN